MKNKTIIAVVIFLVGIIVLLYALQKSPIGLRFNASDAGNPISPYITSISPSTVQNTKNVTVYGRGFYPSTKVELLCSKSGGICGKAIVAPSHTSTKIYVNIQSDAQNVDRWLRLSTNVGKSNVYKISIAGPLPAPRVTTSPFDCSTVRNENICDMMSRCLWDYKNGFCRERGSL